MSFDILLQLDLFRNTSDIPRTRKCLLYVLEAMVNINRVWLHDHAEAPLLYQAGVKYKSDDRPIGPDGERVERWIAIPEIITHRGSDCKNLVAWRCAELREQGVKCWPYLRWKQVSHDFTMYHVLVQFVSTNKLPTPLAFFDTEDGGAPITLEDPSRILGMGQGHGE